MYQRNRRRVAAAIAVAAVAAALTLTACSDEPKEFADKRVGAMDNYAVGVDFKATTPVTFSILINNHPGYPFKEDWPFWQWLQERTNVTFDFVPAPLSDFNTVRTTLVTGGDAPQIMTRFYGNQENEFVGSGALLPVSDYTRFMPNYSARVQAWDMQSDLNTHIQADGKYYVLPGFHEEKRYDYGFAVRKDLMEKYDIDTPRTLDDFYDMLVKLKAECAGAANCYPMSDLFNQAPPTQPSGNLIKTIGAAFGIRTGWDYNTVSWNYDTNQYEITATTPAFRGMLEWINKLITDGLLDPESMTQSDDQARQKLAEGRSFVVSSNAQTIVNNYRQDIAGIPGADMELIPIPTGPFGERLFGGRLENGIALNADSADSENFIALLQFVDWLFYSDNGQEFAKWGKEGETYTKDASGKRTLKPDIRMLNFNVDAPKQLQIDYGVYNGAFVYGGSIDLMHSFYSDEEAALISGQVEGRQVLALPPPAPFDEDQAEEAAFVEGPLTTFVTEQELAFILGERPLSQWDDFVQKVNDLDAGKYLDLVKAAQQAFGSS